MRNEERTNQVLEHFNRIKEDYEPTKEIWGAENERAERIKEIMSEVLTEGERNTLILYAELQSLAEVARVLKVSKATAGNQIQRIRRKIYEHL